MFDENRRKYPRANYPCHLTVWLDGGQTATILTKTTNVGIGGLCVHLNQGIYIGKKVSIQLNFHTPSTPFRCKGVVVRCKHDGDKMYNIGIQFEPLDELKAAFLDGKVSELLALDQKGTG